MFSGAALREVIGDGPPQPNKRRATETAVSSQRTHRSKSKKIKVQHQRSTSQNSVGVLSNSDSALGSIEPSNPNNGTEEIQGAVLNEGMAPKNHGEPGELTEPVAGSNTLTKYSKTSAVARNMGAMNNNCAANAKNNACTNKEITTQGDVDPEVLSGQDFEPLPLGRQGSFDSSDASFLNQALDDTQDDEVSDHKMEASSPSASFDFSQRAQVVTMASGPSDYAKELAKSDDNFIRQHPIPSFGNNESFQNVHRDNIASLYHESNIDKGSEGATKQQPSLPLGIVPPMSIQDDEFAPSFFADRINDEDTRKKENTLMENETANIVEDQYQKVVQWPSPVRYERDDEVAETENLPSRGFQNGQIDNAASPHEKTTLPWLRSSMVPDPFSVGEQLQLARDMDELTELSQHVDTHVKGFKSDGEPKKLCSSPANNIETSGVASANANIHTPPGNDEDNGVENESSPLVEDGHFQDKGIPTSGQEYVKSVQEEDLAFEEQEAHDDQVMDQIHIEPVENQGVQAIGQGNELQEPEDQGANDNNVNDAPQENGVNELSPEELREAALALRSTAFSPRNSPPVGIRTLDDNVHIEGGQDAPRTGPANRAYYDIAGALVPEYREVVERRGKGPFKEKTQIVNRTLDTLIVRGYRFVKPNPAGEGYVLLTYEQARKKVSQFFVETNQH